MIHTAVAQAIRDRLLTLSVATTGPATLGATGTTFTRSVGSFVTEQFAAGMEVTVSGTDSNDGTYVVRKVAALALTVDQSLTTESAGAAKTIAAGLPSKRAYENVPLTPTSGYPYFREQYIPGPSRQATVGSNGSWEFLPQYAAHINVPENTGPEAARRYADAILTLFQPNQSITVGTDTLHVRTDVAPFFGQLIRTDDGWLTYPVTIPFWIRTPRTN